MKQFLFLWSFMIFSFSSKAQDFQFTQFWNSPQAINPAFTGDMRNSDRFSVFNNNGWQLSDDYASHAKIQHQLGFAFKSKAWKNDVWAVGAQAHYMNSDYKWRPNWSGPTEAAASISLAYHKKLNNSEDKQHYLSLGVETLLSQINTLDRWPGVYWGYQFYCSSCPPPPVYSLQKKILNVNLGLAWTYKTAKSYYQVGIIAAHLNQSQAPFPVAEGEIALFPNYRFGLQSFVKQHLSDKWALTSQFNFNLQQALPRESNYSKEWQYYLKSPHLQLGAEYQLHPDWSLSYSFGSAAQISTPRYYQINLINNFGFRYKNLDVQMSLTLMDSFPIDYARYQFALGLVYHWGGI